MGNDNLELRETVHDPLANYVLSPEQRAAPPTASSLVNSPSTSRKELDAQLQETRLRLARAQYPVVNRLEADASAVRRAEASAQSDTWPPPVYDQTPVDAPLDPLYAIAPYVSPTSLGRIVCAALAVVIAFEILTLIAGANMVALMGAGLIAITRIGFAILSIILFQTWMYRVYTNLRSFHAGGLSTTPGNAVASWFIPFMQVYRPWQILSEVWRASDPAFRINPLRPREWQMSSSSLLITCWGLSWLGLNVLAYGCFHRAFSTNPQFYTLLEIARIIFSLLTIFVINRISARQDEKTACLYR